MSPRPPRNIAARLARLRIAEKRLLSILRSHEVANERTIEQKISDAGPTNQRINPHILTQVLTRFVRAGRVVREERDGIPWYYLPETPGLTVEARLAELQQIHAQTVHHDFTLRLGQTLEIAVFRALESLHSDRRDIQFFGSFRDLDEHDDSTLYSKIEPVAISGRPASGAKVVDFVLIEPSGIRAAIEAKNVRQWLYPDRQEIRDLLLKSCDLNAVPVLVARRIPYVTFKVLNACGVLVHENFNQFYLKLTTSLQRSPETSAYWAITTFGWVMTQTLVCSGLSRNNCLSCCLGHGLSSSVSKTSCTRMR